MGWNKEGSTIKAEYCGVIFSGVVLESRVKYGGKVQYKVAAADSIYLPFSDMPRDIVLVDEDEIIADYGVLNAYA
jgi:hypothetical protein